jgi:glycosyltransferase involved in cell wall biosynthesis
MRIFVIGALPSSLTNFRGELLKALSRKSQKVYALSNNPTKRESEQIKALGCEALHYPVARNGLNPVKDLKTWWFLKQLIKQHSPAKQLSYTIKPIIWGGLAARNSDVEQYAMITGLGFAFQPGGVVKSLLIRLVGRLYKLALKNAKAVIFQNRDNMQVFIDKGLVPSKKCFLVNGSGVDLTHYKLTPLPNAPQFTLIARLLGDKGIREYVQAARIVKQKYPQAQFNLVGPEDPSPDGISLPEVLNWSKEGIINYHGAASDVRPFIEKCAVYVLPSYHEGMPRTVLEAMAMGRPILTTDVPGCRETVENGKNGWLVSKANVQQLSERLIWFIEHPEKWSDMGNESYRLAREKFDVNEVNNKILEIMGLKQNLKDESCNEKII